VLEVSDEGCDGARPLVRLSILKPFSISETSGISAVGGDFMGGKNWSSSESSGGKVLPLRLILTQPQGRRTVFYHMAWFMQRVRNY
jgi:hypothetical protein